MIIQHGQFKKEVGSDRSFLLTNNSGGFAYFGQGTKYNGSYFMRDWKFFKAIERIGIPGQCQLMKYEPHCIERQFVPSKEVFYSNHTDTLLYEAQHQGFIELVLDCREMNDYSDVGRIYRIEKKDCLVLIRYEKYKDPELKQLDYRIFVAVAGVKDYMESGKWIRREHPIDQKRKSAPFESYVYEALKIACAGSIRLAVSYSYDENLAISNAMNTLNNFEIIKKNQEKYYQTLTRTNRSVKGEVRQAYMANIAALDNFFVGKEFLGLYAGYPWFAQVWTRDEAICLGALIDDERYDEVKRILFRQLEKILDDGRIPNRFPHSDLGSADGVGWVFLRFYDLIRALEKKDMLNEYLSREDLVHLESRLSLSIQRLLKNHTKDGLAYSGPLETWMDTAYANDDRHGCRIEIQALRMSMYCLMIHLNFHLGRSKEHMYKELLHRMKRNVRSVFFNRPVLMDGAHDRTVRPNIFLAHYIFPDLLSRKEWESCFEYSLKSLYLDWGGIASIDRQHGYFVDEYSGQDNRSYHRGDSWFFVNNIAALCLHRVNSKKFKDRIEAIIQASVRDTLYNGIIGYQSELSSAKEQRAEASLAQAWSSATFIELIKEIYE